MIQKKTVTLWTSSDGKEHRTLEELKRYELVALFYGDGKQQFPGDGCTSWAAGRVMESAAKIMDLLTLTESSIPAARAINGGTKKRKPRKHEALQTTIPGTGLPPEILDEKRKEVEA